MTDETRKIKPKTPVPASHEDLVDSPTPDVELSVGTAARLLAESEQRLDALLEEIAGDEFGTVSGDLLARAYARLRPDVAILSDDSFTSREGCEGVERLVADLQRDRETGADSIYNNVRERRINAGTTHEDWSCPTELSMGWSKVLTDQSPDSDVLSTPVFDPLDPIDTEFLHFQTLYVDIYPRCQRAPGGGARGCV